VVLVLVLVFVTPPRAGERVSEWAAALAGAVSAFMLCQQAAILGGLEGTGIPYLVMLPLLYQIVVPEQPKVTLVVSLSAMGGLGFLAWSDPTASASLVQGLGFQVVSISALAILASYAYRKQRSREDDLEAEKVDALEELSVSEMRLQRTESVAELGMLTAGTAHELNNMLTAVEANLTFAQQQIGAPRQEALSDAREGARRMRSIVRDMQQVTRIESPQMVDVSEAARLAVRLARPTLDPVATLVLDIGTVPMVRAEVGRLAQALLNLMLNAAQAMETGRPGEKRIGLRTWVENELVHIEVHDNGVGIPIDDQQRIWESFYTTKELGGTGLGLPLVKRVAEEAGGDVLLHSTPGLGSSFTLVLPAVGRNRLHVLVVDDDPLVGRSMGRLLDAEFVVTLSTSVEDALARLATTQVDAIVCDVVMPGMDGLDLYHALEREQPQLARRVIFVSGRTARSMPPMPRMPLPKPLNQSDLVDAVRGVVV
jgi:two-component system, cell cycle sensor histidine kinase and response regulator CckA